MPYFSERKQKMLKFVLGGAGSGKSALLANMINEAASQTDKNVIVIVPEQFSVDSDSKLYKKLGCQNFNRIISGTFTSIAREIFEKYGGRSGEYADDTEKLILMRQAIKGLIDEKKLLYFARQALRPDFTAEALNIVSEFRRGGVGADILASKMTTTDVTLSEKLSDISLIYFAYDSALAENSLKDSLTDISEAAAAAEMNDFFKNALVFFDEFDGFTGDEYQLVEAAISQAENVYVALRIAGMPDTADRLFSPVKNTWSKLWQLAQKYSIPTENTLLEKPLKYKSNDLAHLNMNIFRPVRTRYGASENIRICECADLYEEADLICSEIKRLVREEDYKYGEIAVMSRQLQDHTYIFEAAFDKYDIPFSMDVKKSILHTSIAQYVSGVVGAAAEKNFSSEMIFRYAKNQLCNIPTEKISDLENYCFEWDIDGEKWEKPFELDIERHPLTEQTRQEIITPLSKLRQKCRNSDCTGICSALFDFMTEMEVQKKVAETIGKFKDSGLLYLAGEFKRIWGIFIDILEKLALYGGNTSMSEFRDLLSATLRQISYSVPPQTLDGVKILSAETARPDNPRAVFIAGANDGFFPAGVSRAGLLSEKDIKLFENSGIDLFRKAEDVIADERLIAYRTLSHPSERLYISYPIADSSGSHRYPSPLLKQISDMFENDITSFAGKKNLIYYCASKKAAYVNLVRYFGESSAETESLRYTLDKDREYSTRIKYLESVSRERKLEISDTSLMRKLYTERLELSATAIDEYNTCHFKYFCRTGLKLWIRKKRAFDRLGEGNLIHRCLEEILSSCSSKEEFDSLTREQIRLTAQKSGMEFMIETLGAERAAEPSVKAALESIVENTAELITHLQKELGQSDFRPAAFELDISQGSKPVIMTDDGIEIRLRGTADRIDVFEDGDEKYLRIIDYKSGTKKFSMASLLYGLNMQMLLYLFSITGKDGKFSGYKPAGALYMPSGGAGCGLERDSETLVDNYLNEHYKMNGVVLKDRTVLKAMEKDIMGVFIPASVLKADSGTGELKLSKRSCCITGKSFEKLRNYTDDVLMKMCTELYGGGIAADPFAAENYAPCDYCDYQSVCGNDPEKNCRRPADDAENIMMDLIGGNDNEQMD